MKNINPKTKPFPKRKNSEVKDPPRYPKIINAYEDKAKKDYHHTLKQTINEIAKEMIHIVKNRSNDKK
jgi:hypothetical protein